MPKIIEGHDISGFIDHDYEKVEKLSIDGKIDWFEYRFNKILLNPIERIDTIVKKDIEKKDECFLENQDVSVFTIIVLTVCVGIDVLGGFLSGKEKDAVERDFEYFVENYLDSENSYSETPHGDIAEYAILLYKLFRCGLAHNLTIKKIGFCYGELYFRKESGNYYISVDRLLKDLGQAFDNYMRDVRRNKNGLQQKFMSRFSYVFIERV